MGEERLVKKVYRANVEGNRGKGDPKEGEVKEMLMKRESSEREEMVWLVIERLGIGWSIDRSRWKV